MKLNFGCGAAVLDGFVNVDIQKGPGIDKSFDFNKPPYPFKDNTFDYILVDNVLEHLGDVDLIIKELKRIAKNGAIIHIIVPYWNTYHAYGDYTHTHYFNERSFEIMCGKIGYKRDKEKGLVLESLKATPQKYLRWIPMKILRIMSRVLNNIITFLDVKIRIVKDLD